MGFSVPDTLKAALEPDAIGAIEAALGPPPERRASGRFEIEVEAAGEGTFTITYDAGKVSAKKGFAKGDPWVSASVPKGGFGLVQELLQAAVDGFPKAPELSGRLEATQRLSRAEWDKMAAAVEKLRDVVVTMKVAGGGTYRVARGPMDEATRELEVGLPLETIRGVLTGADVTKVGSAKLGGDRGVATELAAAFGPLVSALKPR